MFFFFVCLFVCIVYFGHYAQICDSTSSATSSPKRIHNNNNNNNISNSNININNMGNGAPKLGGLFEGLTAMPKLKPVNGSSRGE